MLFKAHLQTVFLTLVIIMNQKVSSQTYVTVYEHANYGGRSVATGNLETTSHVFLGTYYFNDITSSYKITQGSCVEMHNHNPPSGEWFWSASDTTQVPWEMNDRVSSVKGCGKYSKSIQCPSGQFAKKLSWDNLLTNGIELQCFLPKLTTPSTTYRSHSSGTLRYSRQCNAIRGIRFTRDTKKHSNTGIDPFCTQGQSSGYTYACPNNQVLTGVQMQIENRSNYIKSASAICRDVGKIESTCTPNDELSLLFTCDASRSTVTVKCEHVTTYGYGLVKNQSLEQRTEQIFYENAGFLLDSAGSGLSANFKSKLASKSTTGYDWTNAPLYTFRKETSMTVRAEARPSCIRKVFQVAGECSFMQVRANSFHQVDNCFDPVNN